MAIDSNIYKTDDATAQYVNPEYWSQKLVKALREKVVLEKFGRQDFRGLGKNVRKINIPKNAYETAGELTEGVATPVSALSYSEVEITFTEYGIAYQVSEKELNSGLKFIFPDIVERATYALAAKKEQVIRDALLNGAGLSKYVNDKDNTTITSDDTLDLDTIIDAMALMKAQNAMPRVLVIHPNQEKSIKKLLVDGGSNVIRDKLVAVENGFIGLIAGADVYVNNFIKSDTENSITVYKAIMLGPNAFAVAYQQEAKIRWKEDSILDRAVTFEAHECYGVGVLEPNAICVITSA
ncbi:MAG: phage major capsid protein [Thermoplasmata archaeon]|nr:MAG: phage major capsid protein [Thermoplasmata archaeon]